MELAEGHSYLFAFAWRHNCEEGKHASRINIDLLADQLDPNAGHHPLPE